MARQWDLLRQWGTGHTTTMLMVHPLDRPTGWAVRPTTTTQMVRLPDRPTGWVARPTTTMRTDRRREGPPRWATRPTTTTQMVRRQGGPRRWATRPTTTARMARRPERLRGRAGKTIFVIVQRRTGLRLEIFASSPSADLNFPRSLSRSGKSAKNLPRFRLDYPVRDNF